MPNRAFEGLNEPHDVHTGAAAAAGVLPGAIVVSFPWGGRKKTWVELALVPEKVTGNCSCLVRTLRQARVLATGGS